MAAGVAGLWEWDHRRDTVQYCPIAAKLLTGDVDLAWHHLAPAEAFGEVHAEDAAYLRGQMRRAVSVPDVRIRAYRLCSDQAGARRILCRGQASHNDGGRPIRTMGVVIDITDLEDGDSGSFVDGVDNLDRAAKHGLAVYEAVEATGLKSLLPPARALLFAIGHEIVRSVSRKRGPLQ